MTAAWVAVVTVVARSKSDLPTCPTATRAYLRAVYKLIRIPGVLLVAMAMAMALPAAGQPTSGAPSCEQATRNYQAVNGAPVREPRTVELAWRDVQRVCGAAASAEPPPQQYIGPASTDPRPVAPRTSASPSAPTGSNFSQQRSPLK